MKYRLHFVGKGLYSKEDFIIEAEKHGVNRAFSPKLAQKFNFGDKILLAQFEPVKKDEEGKIIEQGKALVFGYFVLSGVTFNPVDNREEFMGKLNSQLDIINITPIGEHVSRKCGSYTIGVVATVKNDLKDIMEKAIKIAKEMEVKVKVFLSGKFYQITMKEITPIKFHRSGREVEVDVPLESEEVKDKLVRYIGDYKQKLYLLKKDREKLEKKENKGEDSENST